MPIYDYAQLELFLGSATYPLRHQSKHVQINHWTANGSDEVRPHCPRGSTETW